MTERKTELPKLDLTEDDMELGLGAARMACRERQLLAALAKIADMEALLRECFNVMHDVEWSGEDISCPQCYVPVTHPHKQNCTLRNAIKRVDAMLAEGL